MQELLSFISWLVFAISWFGCRQGSTTLCPPSGSKNNINIFQNLNLKCLLKLYSGLFIQRRLIQPNNDPDHSALIGHWNWNQLSIYRSLIAWYVRSILIIPRKTLVEGGKRLIKVLDLMDFIHTFLNNFD